MLKRLKPEANDPRDPEQAARSAALSYSSDEEPGIRRQRKGRGFSYRDAEGATVTDPETVGRIRALVIPPAWTDVWISPDPSGHLQATGRDARGRKQYRYHEQWSESRDAAKFAGLADFAAALPDIREAVDRDLRKRGLSRERVVASVVWLLDNTMIRVGSAAYARDNGSFGLTTLKSRHLDIDGSRLRFEFKGKSGKVWNLRLSDRRIARVLRSIQELPGQQLFQYVDDDGERRSVRSDDVNARIQAAAGEEFSSKHFRTWGGTVQAAALLRETPLPKATPAQARALNAIVDKVAARLGNTRAVCRSCYIHPRIIESWSSGTLAEELEATRRGWRKRVPGLDDDEMTVLRWLNG